MENKDSIIASYCPAQAGNISFGVDLLYGRVEISCYDEKGYLISTRDVTDACYEMFGEEGMKHLDEVYRQEGLKDLEEIELTLRNSVDEN